MLKYEEEIRIPSLRNCTEREKMIPSFPKEDKQEICSLLCKALRATINARDLVSLSYYPENEIVIACFRAGGTKQINVALDSGTAMIRDIMRHLGV